LNPNVNFATAVPSLPIAQFRIHDRRWRGEGQDSDVEIARDDAETVVVPTKVQKSLSAPGITSSHCSFTVTLKKKVLSNRRVALVMAALHDDPRTRRDAPHYDIVMGTIRRACSEIPRLLLA
jgi:hypothetical protein